MPATRRPLVLAILDGWGYSEDPAHNAILGAHTPNWDRLWATHPHTLIDTSGLQRRLDVPMSFGYLWNLSRASAPLYLAATFDVVYARRDGVDATYAVALSKVRPLLEAAGIR